MNKKLVSLLLLSSFILTGCSNNTKPTQIKTQPTTNIETTIETTQEINEIFIYNLDGKSPEKIVEEIEYYFNNLPENGQSIENIKSKLKVEPIAIKDFAIYYFDREIFRDPSCISNNYEPFNFNNFSPKNNCILGINYTNCELGMDGKSIDIRENSPIYIEMELSVLDYETASKVYDILCAKYVTVDKYGTDDRNGTLWTAFLDHVDEDGNARFMKLFLTKQNNCYRIQLTYTPTKSIKTMYESQNIETPIVSATSG